MHGKGRARETAECTIEGVREREGRVHDKGGERERAECTM